jgi:hypothetical protein
MIVALAAVAAAIPQVGRADPLDLNLGGVANGVVNLGVADVITGGVTLDDPATATVHATIDPNTVGTSYHFEYGPGTSLSLSTPTVSLGTSLDPQEVSQLLPGLVPGTAYSYRAVVDGPNGTLSVGPTQSFSTPGRGRTRKAGSSSCTIKGTAKADSLRGTRKKDVICGLGGNDKIRGLGGNDVIRGGAGKDRIFGGPGRDRVYGNSSNDSLFGQSGNDRLYGGGGKDRLSGGPGHDRAVYDSRDRLRSVESSKRR